MDRRIARTKSILESFSEARSATRCKVFHIRHWARKPVEADELADLMDEAADPESETEEGTF